MHPSFIGTPVGVWFVDGDPVRLVAGGRRLRIVGSPQELELDGEPGWRLRTRLECGAIELVEIRREGSGWVIAGLRAETPAGREEPATARRR